MQKNQQETNLKNHSPDSLQQSNQKRKSIQAPFEDAIFLEDGPFPEINENYSPESRDDISDFQTNRKMTEIVDKVDKVSRKNIIKRVFDFSPENKSNKEVQTLPPN